MRVTKTPYLIREYSLLESISDLVSRFVVCLASNETTVFGDEATEDEGSDCGKLDQNVDGRSRSVLKRVTNGVTNNSSLVWVITLTDGLSLLFSRLVWQESSLDVFLSVVPAPPVLEAEKAIWIPLTMLPA